MKLESRSSIVVPSLFDDLTLDPVKGLLASLRLALAVAQGQAQRRSMYPSSACRSLESRNETTGHPPRALSQPLPLALSHLHDVNHAVYM